jgi:hypothetical protein
MKEYTLVWVYVKNGRDEKSPIPASLGDVYGYTRIHSYRGIMDVSGYLF